MAESDFVSGGTVTTPAGFSAGGTFAGIKKKGDALLDLGIIYSREPCTVSGVFTSNKIKSAAVVVNQQRLATGGKVSAVVANSGCANSSTGEQGLSDAVETTELAGKALGIEPEEVLVASTGVIGVSLPMEALRTGINKVILTPEGGHDFARAIMTTDTVPKGCSRRVDIAGHSITVTGIAKGSGMIRPNMATMLGFIATDALVEQKLLQQATTYAADRTFNCVTVDGDTSTNDALIVAATGQSNAPEIARSDSIEFKLFLDALTEVATVLAQALVRDGEGATKFITIQIEGGMNETECRKVGYAIAHSPLVKTAFFASDPNLGRILAAIGYAGIDDLDVSGVDLYLDDVIVAKSGERAPGYHEEDGQRVMNQSEITVRVGLNRGASSSTVWTCDLSHDYVTINADYRS